MSEYKRAGDYNIISDIKEKLAGLDKKIDGISIGLNDFIKPKVDEHDRILNGSNGEVGLKDTKKTLEIHLANHKWFIGLIVTIVGVMISGGILIANILKVWGTKI